jgi:hypothetical protein
MRPTSTSAGSQDAGSQYSHLTIDTIGLKINEDYATLGPNSGPAVMRDTPYDRIGRAYAGVTLTDMTRSTDEKSRIDAHAVHTPSHDAMVCN